MEYEIFIHEGNRHLVTRVHEPVTEGLLEEIIGKAAQKANESSIDKILFDLRRAANQASLTSQWWAINQVMKDSGFKPGSKHALLVTPKLLEDYEFLETVLLNAHYRSKRFTDESEAIKWLEE
jgi:hypothetical protein